MFCRRLERAGHITMVKNDKDARFINVALTEKGRSLVQGMIEQMGSHSEKDTMSKEDLETNFKRVKMSGKVFAELNCFSGCFYFQEQGGAT